MSDSEHAGVPPKAIEELAARLGGRDPFEVQEELVPALRAVAAAKKPEALTTPEGPEKWSVVEVIQHLADAELAYGFRLRMILAQERPALQAFDQNLWAHHLRYRETRVEDALELLSALRAANLRIYRALDPAQWERVGVHSEAGPVSARMILFMLANHDLTHRRQIERIGQVVGGK